MKTISTIVLAGVLGLCALSASAEKAMVKTVAAVYKEKTALAGKTVSVKGKVVKVNNGIMGRNFVHVQDGTSSPDSDRIIVTSKQTAMVGDQVTVTGLVVLDRDFGSGYGYPLLLEETSITPAK
jgi:DNA/RNA endonuclease YhcR with UshA esterase domain